jgi:hypothetical protein
MPSPLPSSPMTVASWTRRRRHHGGFDYLFKWTVKVSAASGVWDIDPAVCRRYR